MGPRTYRILLGGSILLLASSFVVIKSAYEQVVFSLLAFILPILVGVWLIPIIVYSFYHFRKAQRSDKARLLGLLIGYVMTSLLLWPPQWLLRSTDPLDKVRAELKHEAVISLMTWNLQRFGDLGKTAPLRAQSRAERLSCLEEVLKESKEVYKQPIELFAFQEVSNKNLKYLEHNLDLVCQHIAYHSLTKSKSGLGLCASQAGLWRLNYVRNITLSGQGRWRALFAELSHRDHSTTTFNLLNVHFLPHGIGTQDLKKAIFSFKTLLNISKEIIQTSNAQYQQAEGLLSVIKNYQDPTLLVGDFNAPPHAGAHPILAKSWDDVWQMVGTTFGATKYFGGLIPYRIDFVYALKQSFRLFEARVHRSSEHCSDHQPLITTLGLPK
jgi:hypothetical protein